MLRKEKSTLHQVSAAMTSRDLDEGFRSPDVASIHVSASTKFLWSGQELHCLNRKKDLSKTFEDLVVCLSHKDMTCCEHPTQ